MAEKFSEYFLNLDWVDKMEMAEKLCDRGQIFLDKTVIFKTELTKLFIEVMKLDVDCNLVVTACLLFECKKRIQNGSVINQSTYLQDGADFLSTIGFDDRFCRICRQVFEYSESEKREKESEIIELSACYGDLVLDNPQRKGYESEEAIKMLKDMFKNSNNHYVSLYVEFFNKMQEVYI